VQPFTGDDFVLWVFARRTTSDKPWGESSTPADEGMKVPKWPMDDTLGRRLICRLILAYTPTDKHANKAPEETGLLRYVKLKPAQSVANLLDALGSIMETGDEHFKSNAPVLLQWLLDGGGSLTSGKKAQLSDKEKAQLTAKKDGKLNYPWLVKNTPMLHEFANKKPKTSGTGTTTRNKKTLL